MKQVISILMTASAVSGFSSSHLLQSRVISSTSALRMIPCVNERSISALKSASVIEEATATSAEEDTDRLQKSYLDDGFVFGLEGSGLDRPKGKKAQLVVEGDSLETKPWQVAVVAGTFLGHTFFAANAFNGMLEANGGNILFTTVQAIALLLSSWILADFGSGVLHWSVDNYGNGRTPIMGGIIAGFQGHHSAPWTITERGFCNNIYRLCIPFGVVPMAFINMISGPFTTYFFTVFCVMEILSQEFHKWSHMTKGECPGWVNSLQEYGLTIGRKPHAQHHLSPYDGNYCIISGVCNEWLDSSGFFRRFEHLIYKWNGVESNAWKLDSQLKERILRGEYRLQK
jgi:ubiquitin-conjugating enzyme E2 variant